MRKSKKATKAMRNHDRDVLRRVLQIVLDEQATCRQVLAECPQMLDHLRDLTQLKKEISAQIT